LQAKKIFRRNGKKLIFCSKQTFLFLKSKEGYLAGNFSATEHGAKLWHCQLQIQPQGYRVIVQKTKIAKI
jgi:hypothetical protein